MRRSRRLEAVGSVLLAGAAADGAARLLTPRGAVRAPLPVELRDHFSDAEIERGRRYARPQRALGLLSALIDAAVLTWVVRRTAQRETRAAGPEAPSTGAALLGSAATAAALSTGLTVPTLPVAALMRHRAIRFGLATQSWRDWGADLLKATAIQGGFAAGGGAVVTAMTRRWPRGWWLPAAGASVVFGAGLAAAAPVLLDPIFNDFTPLPDGETRSDVLALAREAGVKVGQVFSIDASRRTTAANAYVTGLGPTKRVVLFDTLLDRYSRDEVRGVVAHELAHVRHRDVARSIAFAGLTAPAVALAAQRLAWALSRERGTARALPALALAAGVASVPAGVTGARLSRAVERRADDFALRLTGAPQAFVSFERAIALQNVADLDPPRLSRMLASHPPTAERIGAALSYAEHSGRAHARPS